MRLVVWIDLFSALAILYCRKLNFVCGMQGLDLRLRSSLEATRTRKFLGENLPLKNEYILT